VMHGYCDDAVDLFAVPNITGKSERLLRMADACPGSFRAGGIAGEHYYLRSLIDEKLCNRFANSHGCARNYGNFAREFHVGFVS
jgi:hypothetical protein